MSEEIARARGRRPRSPAPIARGRVGVRVRVSITPRVGPCAGTPLETVALVNSGYEAREAEVIVPLALATQLGFQPLPAGTMTATYETVGGDVQVSRIPGGANVALVAPGGPPVLRPATVIVSAFETEALMSDRLASDLEIAIIDPAGGLWQLRSGLGAGTLPSEPAETW